MYKVSTEVYENILREMKEELNKRDYNYSESALREILNTWKSSKGALLELLSKHPNWDADRLMIKFDTDFSREIDVIKAKQFVLWLRKYSSISSIMVEIEDPFGFITSHSYHLSSVFDSVMTYQTYLQEDDIDFINAINNLSETFNFRPGMKSTKVMRKICEHYGWDKIKGYHFELDGTYTEVNQFEREYAKYCDALCPIKVTRHTCISLNPIDFLLMSNGNSWNSCHYIGKSSHQAGCYSSGTISYMLDEHSFVFYTVSSDFNGVEIERQPKLQRQMFGYNDNQLFQSRLYPTSNDSGAKQTYTDIRNIVQKVIADCCNKPNLWVKRSTNDDVWLGSGATAYPDWEHFNSLCSISTFKDSVDDDHNGIEMGTEPICIVCGYSHETEDSISCCSSKYECECCGSAIDDEDDVYYVDDRPYCRDCVIYCEICGRYELTEHSTYIDGEGIDVCNECRDEYFTWCGCCNEYVRNENVTYVENDGFFVCDGCLEDNYTQCADCGDYIAYDDAHEVINKETGEITFYCNSCFDEMEDENDEDDEEEAV